jgi:pimeloyl-ACP methyl ester carboxylesterase
VGGHRAGRLGRDERRAALAAPAPADGFTSRRYAVGGLDLHVRQRPGPPATGPTCVLVHGLAVSHRYLMPTARWLRRPVHVPDLPGFGLSGRPDRVYGVAGHAEVLGRLLDSLGAEPVCLLGNSFGCQVAVELARQRPDLVAALVLVGPTVDPVAGTVAGQVLRWLRDLRHEDVRQAAILARDVRDAGPRRIAATLRLSVRDRIEAKLPFVGAPVLLVRGEHDRICPPRWLHDAAARIADARCLTLPGSAHNAVTTAGPQLAAAVDTFLTTAAIRPVQRG